ncbi:MAG: nuclear transport factor 2 family protein [Alphaproteobacteria bacterium]|nr:nuclear transport factor 2 family protein [Alphaproteobacteria bacterium]MDE2110073.1 nuclear transport factor 2 family protein [Alphaproteobacteria bacterium]MDE2495022.1 nuclear transport factor 2 family protein [Alphaproteobacteria bacterium]
MSKKESSILQILNIYHTSVFTKNADAFLALYDQNVQVFDMWGAWSYRGIEAWRGAIADWFEKLGSERVVVDFDDVQTMETPDVAVIHTFVTYKALSAQGVELRSMSNRMTLALQKSDGIWKIIHEHTSAPINHETLKATLKR